MITVHISPSEEKVVIEHLPLSIAPLGSLELTPEEAYSILMRLKERQSDIYKMVVEREKRGKNDVTTRTV